MKRMLSFIAAALTGMSAAAQTDLITVTARINADEQGQALTAATVQGYRDALSTTGTWADVDYPDKSITGWSPATHTARLLELARAYRKPGHALYGETATSNAIHRALGWWLANDLTSSNWWYNEIDTPRKLGRILLLLGSEATTGEVAGAMTMLNRSQNYMSWTGQNRMWEAGNTLVKGLILSNAGICVTSSAAIHGLNIITTAEGIQPDFSFQQHGPQLYTGGYGASYAADAPFWLDMLRGTAWAATTAQTAVVVNYLLEGVRWVIWEKQWVFDVTGRGISRGVPSATSMRTPFWRMTNIAPAQASQFAGFASALNGAGVFGTTLQGHRFYWHSDHAVHRATNWSVTVRMCSTRVQGTETGNGEGLKDYHLGDATTFLLRDGNEYRGIQPVWDWRKLPGVTCPQKPGALPVLGWSGYMGSNSFVGGVTDGTNGAAIMTLARDGLSARKAAFLFDDAALFLGAGIVCTNITNAIATTINQSLWTTPAVSGRIGATQTFAAGQFTVTNVTWVHQGGFGYLPMDTNRLWRLTLQPQTGRWSDINEAYSTQWISTNVFTLWLDHGSRPTNRSYAYAVVPASTSSVMPALAATPPVAVVTNAAALQAAWHAAGKQLQAIFHQAGAVTTPDGTRVESDASCALMARFQADAVLLAASRPNQTTAALTVRVSRVLSGPGATWLATQSMTRIVMAMPSGNNAGASVSVRLTGAAVGPPRVTSAHGADTWLTTAGLHGALTNGGAADVSVVWDAADRGTNLGLWAASVRTPGLFEGAFSTLASNLAPGSSYVYRCFASNSHGVAWSEPRPFRMAGGSVRPDALPGLTMWLDAGDIHGDGTTVAGGTAVTNWADKSGSLRHALAGTNAVNWPRVLANALNGRPVVNFDGNDYLEAGTNSVHDNTTGMTVFVICRTPAVADIAVVSKTWWSANQREWVIHTADYQCQQQTNLMNAGQRLDFPAVTNVQQLAARWQPAVRNELFRDGAPLGTTAVSAASMSQTAARLLIGSANNVDPGRFLTGEIAELIIYARAIGTNELHQIGAGLAEKYGLAYAQDFRNPDADGDQIPDDWERINHGGVAALSSGDTDGDRMNDWQEYVAGTNPLDASSFLAVQSSHSDTGLLLLAWPSATGRMYALQRAATPDVPYTDVVSNIAATPSLNIITTQPAQASGVFRIRVQP